MATDFLSRANTEEMLDAVTSEALNRVHRLMEQFDALEGRSTASQAVDRVMQMSPKRVMGVLDQLRYPPNDKLVAAADKEGRWRTSKARAAVEASYRPNERGRAMFCISSLESRDRWKTLVSFWGLLGLHPRDLQDDGAACSLDLAWQFFVHWKTFAELASRASGHKDGRLFSSLAKGFRILTETMLTTPPANLERLRRSLQGIGSQP